MGNYIFTYADDNAVYTLQDEEQERTIIDNYVDQEINNKNFWYWGFIDDLITEKMLQDNKDNDLQTKLISQE